MAMINDCDHNLLVWIDLEMSGLDLSIHTIVEIAIAITDFQLKNYIEGPDIVIHHDQDILDKMNDWSRQQHTKSGLIQLIQQSQISLHDAETAVIDFLKQYCPIGSGILAGNSVFVDRWFIEKYMPRLNGILHPSIVDCSTLKELTLRWQPVRYTKRPHKQMMHRARDDIQESINELNHYRQHNFYFGWHTIRHPPYLPAPSLSNPRTHLVWLKTDSNEMKQIYVIITDGNLNILNEIYLETNEKSNEYNLLVGFLHKNILVNRSSPICGQRVHIDRARIERILPAFISCCHYRSIDVDVLNVLCQRWAKKVYENRPILFNDSNNIKTELQGSIKLLEYYRANVFKSDLFVQENKYSMLFIDIESIWLIIYLLIILISFLIHKYFLINLIKKTFSFLSLYIILISLLACNDLLLNFIYENISNTFMYILFIIDGILTGALLALLVIIYSYIWCMFHFILLIIIISLSNYYHLYKLKKDFLLKNSSNDFILIIINLLHVVYCFLNGLQTYMHRIVALSGLCISFYIILFQEFNIEFEFPLPMIIIHFVQSIRAFFLYSVVICIRNRTSYW